MRVLPLADEVYSTGQVFERDLELLAKQGVKCIVNNRFDDEVPGQPASADLEKAAGEFGITYVHFPVEPKS
ncbi:MAG: sulfur transferase domain-containing protein, partial [Woeseiaceae bacterium]|nr:sulfur transferase domain-containing protein [Woeseiaceae bacterium]